MTNKKPIYTTPRTFRDYDMYREECARARGWNEAMDLHYYNLCLRYFCVFSQKTKVKVYSKIIVFENPTSYIMKLGFSCAFNPITFRNRLSDFPCR